MIHLTLRVHVFSAAATIVIIYCGDSWCAEADLTRELDENTRGRTRYLVEIIDKGERLRPNFIVISNMRNRETHSPLRRRFVPPSRCRDQNRTESDQNGRYWRCHRRKFLTCQMYVLVRQARDVIALAKNRDEFFTYLFSDIASFLFVAFVRLSVVNEMIDVAGKGILWVIATSFTTTYAQVVLIHRSGV